MKKLFVLFLLVLVFACGKKPADEIKSVVISAPSASVTEYQIPIKPTEDKIETPGKDEKKLLAEIEVPPSTKPTKVKIYKEDVNIIDRLTRKKDESKNPISAISDNKDVKARFMEVRPWWEYVMWVVGILTSIMALIKIFGESVSWLKGPYNFVIKIFRFWRKK